jgi:SAM-dependent methyltransferase
VAVASPIATSSAAPAALRLFEKSVLKQAKFRVLSRHVGDPSRRRCLDLGADNGVLSHLFRAAGGEWTSADLSEKAVASIRELVGERVLRIDGRRLPFEDASFDLVVVIDMLEHVADDRALVAEIARVLRPGGDLVVNVPHAKRWSLARPLRNLAGLTDEWHGHLRPGYDLGSLRALLDAEFEIIQHETYSKLFSELLDIALNYAYARRSGGRGPETEKGTVVTTADLAAREGDFRKLARVYPALRAFAALDAACVGSQGYFLVARARRRGTSAGTGSAPGERRR